MKNSLFGQVKDAIRNAVSGHSEDQLHRQKHGNGELDISEGVLNSIASNASPEEQEQLKQFQNSLHQAYDTDGESHSKRKAQTLRPIRCLISFRMLLPKRRHSLNSFKAL